MSKRKSWGAYFIGIARAVSERATCDRRAVGCVLVEPRTKSILATGFNGAARGLPHCDDVGHDLSSTTLDGAQVTNCQRVVHAEANAVAMAARMGHALDGAHAYVTTYPCWPCFRLLVQAGVTAVTFEGSYKLDPRVQEAAERLGVTIHKLDPSAARDPVLIPKLVPDALPARPVATHEQVERAVAVQKAARSPQLVNEASLIVVRLRDGTHVVTRNLHGGRFFAGEVCDACFYDELASAGVPAILFVEPPEGAEPNVDHRRGPRDALDAASTPTEDRSSVGRTTQWGLYVVADGRWVVDDASGGRMRGTEEEMRAKAARPGWEDCEARPLPTHPEVAK